ncbi:MAG: hypothetical protein CL610_29720 [Anaerolineaceae bacterium]|nr:hypothetical protein [Anaerolineaceae bacterium]
MLAHVPNEYIQSIAVYFATIHPIWFRIEMLLDRLLGFQSLSVTCKGGLCFVENDGQHIRVG